MMHFDKTNIFHHNIMSQAVKILSPIGFKITSSNQSLKIIKIHHVPCGMCQGGGIRKKCFTSSICKCCSGTGVIGTYEIITY